MIVVAKIGTSSVAAADGSVDTAAVGKLCAEVAALRREGHTVVIVTSGAVTAGVAAMGPSGEYRRDPMTLQALSTIGQPRLMRVYEDALAAHGLLSGQVLLAPLDLAHRQRYLHARATFTRLLELGVVPVVNENDAVADDEIRFGDNDRLAALVAHLLGADVLVLLTDTAGLLSADPRRTAERDLDRGRRRDRPGARAGGGRGGERHQPGGHVLQAGGGQDGPVVRVARRDRLGEATRRARRLGGGQTGRRDDLSAPGPGAAGSQALDRLRPSPGGQDRRRRRSPARVVVERGKSLLPAGVLAVEGAFEVDDAVEIVSADKVMFAKGIAQLGASRAAEWVGLQTSELADDLRHEVVHRDDLVVL